MTRGRKGEEQKIRERSGERIGNGIGKGIWGRKQVMDWKEERKRDRKRQRRANQRWGNGTVEDRALFEEAEGGGVAGIEEGW